MSGIDIDDIAGVLHTVNGVVNLDTDAVIEERLIAVDGAIEAYLGGREVPVIGPQRVRHLGNIFVDTFIVIGIEGEDLAVIGEDTVADILLLKDFAVDIGRGQDVAQVGSAIGLTHIIPLHIGGIGGNGRRQVHHGAIGHIGSSILQASHVGAVAEVADQTGCVVVQGEFSIGITLAVEQIEVVAINLVEDRINIIDEILIHVVAVLILIEDTVAPQQLNTQIGIGIIIQILSHRHADDTRLGVEVAPYPGIIGLVPPQGVLDIGLAIGAKDKIHLVGELR